jgi:peptide-methionine (R)-S-oxide reductase
MNAQTTRGAALAALGACAGALILGIRPGGATQGSSKTQVYKVTMSDEQWHKKLTPDQYAVLREQATERAFTSPLLEEHRKGTFLCAGCSSKLFSSQTKFESGSGWPSFWQPIDKDAVATTVDYAIGVPRTEVHCATCGGHLGHVFDDGPAPTHLRYCMNGVALTFEPEKA